MVARKLFQLNQEISQGRLKLIGIIVVLAETVNECLKLHTTRRLLVFARSSIFALSLTPVRAKMHPSTSPLYTLSETWRSLHPSRPLPQSQTAF
jgi:hypothetical protein